MSAQYTQEECQKMFLEALAANCRYWTNLELTDDTPGIDFSTEAARTKWKVEGLAFSVLNLLDGGAGMMPAFEVYPAPHESDKAYHQDEGSNYWPGPPEKCLDAEGNEIPTIHGGDMLHELWHKYVPKDK